MERIRRRAPVDSCIEPRALFLRLGKGSTQPATALPFQPTFMQESRRTKNVRIELWTKGGLISGSKRRFSRQMDETIDGAVKQFVVDWTLGPQ